MAIVKVKKYVLMPRDALELMTRRYVDLAEAIEAASTDCAENGQTVHVVEIRAIAARADRPVKVTKL